MNTVERIKLVKAMEYIARQVNDESIFEGWLSSGVADGDIEYGDLSISQDDLSDAWGVRYWTDDDINFADLMDTFLWLMAKARKSGGLYCDEVVSKPEEV